MPEGYTSEAFSDLLLEKAHVVVAPGNGFGDHGEGYVRVGLLTSEERLQEAAQRIAALNLFEKAIDNIKNGAIIQAIFKKIEYSYQE